MPYGVVANYGVRPTFGVVANVGVQPNYGTGGSLVDGEESAFSGTFSVAADDTDLSVTFTANDASGNPVAGFTPSLTVDVGDLSAALSSVNIAPATIANDGTDSATLTVTLRDTTNQPMRNIPAANITLGGTTNLTVTAIGSATDANGGITYSVVSSTEATYTITATFNGLLVTDTAGLSVTSGATLSDTPNAPGGYTAIIDQPFNSLSFTDSGVTWLNGAGYPTPIEGSVAIVTDSGAPESPSNILRWTYPIGFDSDNAPGYREGVFGEAYSSLYTCIWFRPSSTWEDHVSGVNKLFYWTAENTPEQTGTSFVSLFFNGTAAPTAFRFITQNPSAGQVIYTTSGFTPTLGEWHRMEVLQERTSGINGRVRVWCAKESAPSAVLALDETGVVLTDTGETTVQWVGIVANPYWGGNADVATQEFTLDFDHLLVTGVPN